MVDHIRETMLGATEAFKYFKSQLGGELNNDQLGMLKPSRPNSSSDFRNRYLWDIAIFGRHAKVNNQRTQLWLQTDAPEAGGTTKEYNSNIGQSWFSEAQTLDMDFVTRLGHLITSQFKLVWMVPRVNQVIRGKPTRFGKARRGRRPSGLERDRCEWVNGLLKSSATIKVKVDEGEWLVKRAEGAGLGSFDISSNWWYGVFGSIRDRWPSSKRDPQFSAVWIERALWILSSVGEQKVRLEVLESNSLGENGELVDAPEIVISASELSNSLPERFKAGDGLDVFV